MLCLMQEELAFACFVQSNGLTEAVQIRAFLVVVSNELIWNTMNCLPPNDEESHG